MSNNIEDAGEKVLRTLAQLYAFEEKKKEVEILTKADVSIEETSYDNWDGGQFFYTITLGLPSQVYRSLEGKSEAFATEFKEKLTPMMSGFGNNIHIHEVVITLKMEDDANWRANAEKWLDERSGDPDPEKNLAEYDAFLSHASEDKKDFVRPLAEGLSARGYKIWYDEFELTVGDSLAQRIDAGLAKSRYGIVVLSQNFFRKDWSRLELDGLVTRQVVGRKVILPVWHGISKDEVAERSPTLADRLAIDSSSHSIKEVIDELAKVLGDPGASKI